jgi:DNA-binding GntR family transcriptional regulator
LVTSIYKVIAGDIIDRIESGELRPGDRLPSTANLMKQYQCGNTAVRNAILTLKAHGYVDGHQGKAVFVLDRPKRMPRPEL